jgi:tetraacyldisaccharide 4'-kinase
LNIYSPDYFVLDDAFQHRKLQGSFYILLTTYQRPFFNDLVLPAGRLRETRSNKNRANMIIVSKCPPTLTTAQADEFRNKIKPLPTQEVYFTSITYSAPHLINGTFEWNKVKRVVLVTGIVDPTPIQNHLEQMGMEVILMAFADHYMYTAEDIQKIISAVQATPQTVVATTSKDAVKLKPLVSTNAQTLPVYELPITINVLFNQEQKLLTQINTHVGII